MKILFLCVANSARSILAEGLAKKYWGHEHEFYSAGSNPASPHPMALKTLKTFEINSTDFTSQHIDEFDLNNMDYIITLCKEEYCPHISGNTLHWPFPDPVSLDKDSIENSFILTAHNIKAKLDKLMETL